MGDLSDHQLLSLVIEKNRDALSELYDRYSGLLYGVIVAIVRNTDDAEDLLQEVFVQLWRRASTYQPELAAPKTWLVKMAHNRAIDMLRSKRYQQKKQEVETPGGEQGEGRGEPAVEATWIETVREDRSHHLSRALERLTDQQRQLIDLAFFQGFTHHEISLSTSIPLGTVKTRIRAGMQSLRASLHFMADELR